VFGSAKLRQWDFWEIRQQLKATLGLAAGWVIEWRAVCCDALVCT